MQAVEHCLSTGDGTRTTANLFQIPRTTLRDYIKKVKKLPENERVASNINIGYAKQTIFTVEQEQRLVDYLKRAADFNFGLNPKEVRILAYQCAKRFNIPIPHS